MREFRLLDDKRKQGGLTATEEQRWNELRQSLGFAGPPPPPHGYTGPDGNWYPYYLPIVIPPMAYGYPPPGYPPPAAREPAQGDVPPPPAYPLPMYVGYLLPYPVYPGYPVPGYDPQGRQEGADSSAPPPAHPGYPGTPGFMPYPGAYPVPMWPPAPVSYGPPYAPPQRPPAPETVSKAQAPASEAPPALFEPDTESQFLYAQGGEEEPVEATVRLESTPLDIPAAEPAVEAPTSFEFEAEPPPLEDVADQDQPLPFDLGSPPLEPGMTLDGSPEESVPLAQNMDFVGYQPAQEEGLAGEEYSLPPETMESPEYTSGPLAGLSQEPADYHVAGEAPAYELPAQDDPIEGLESEWAAPPVEAAPEPAWDAPLQFDAPAPDWSADATAQEDAAPWEGTAETSFSEDLPLAPDASAAEWEVSENASPQSSWEEVPVDLMAPPDAELPAIEVDPSQPEEIELATEEIVEPDPSLVAPFSAPSYAAELPPFDVSDGLPIDGTSSMVSTTFVEGEHRVIIHMQQGQVKRGVVRDLDLMDDGIPLEQQTGFAPERIPCSQVKAIFFMLPVGSQQPVPSGDKIRVTFTDGRQVTGFSENYQNTDPGFFMIPADNRTNTARIYVFRASVQAVTPG